MKIVEEKIQIVLEELAMQRAIINRIRKDLLNINARIAYIELELNKMRRGYEGPSNN